MRIKINLLIFDIIRFFFSNKGQCKGCGPDGSKCAFMGPLGPSSDLNPNRGDSSIKLFYETNWKPPYCRKFTLKN